MLETVLLDRALCLPAVDVAALLRGRLIVAIPKVSVQKGWTFALYPCPKSNNALSIEQQYHSRILPLAQIVPNRQSQTIAIEAWARCEHLKMLHEVEQIEALSGLTIWTRTALEKALKERQHLFLAFLRIYRIPSLIEVTNNIVTSEKFGKFVSLSVFGKQFNEPLRITEALPVLQDSIFEQRKQLLEELRPPLYPELEELQGSLTQLTVSNSKARVFEEKIKAFLGWADISVASQSDPDLSWIRTISEVGNSSDGHKFEKLVRRGLIKLGFCGEGLDPNGTGGAGGMDFYCQDPYSMVGECKATKTEMVSDGTPAQLLKIGMNHLGKDQYERAIKLIVAAGDLNFYAQRTATENQMNVIRPETLQRLVEIQAEHPGAVDLLELRNCLQNSPFGWADEKVNRYVDGICESLKIRSQIIEAVKQLTRPEKKQLAVMEIRVFHNAKFVENSSAELDDQTVHELLIELSSPLTGYLGRIKGTSLHSDRFYFLRDMPEVN